ncbi:MAG: UbiA family prenyltransferase [Planctomycetota bacterium]
MNIPFRQRAAAWGRLLRLPNLFTVPGDVVAGAAWSGGDLAATAWSVPAVMLIYAGGLLLNDYFDRAVDARERPQRPIPSERVKATSVLTAGLAALAGGTGLAWLAGGTTAGSVALATSILVLLYDGGVKSLPLLGPLVMGLCRGGAVLVGGAATSGTVGMPVMVVAGMATAYTAVLTGVARGEMSGGRPGAKAYLPAAVVIAAGLVSPWMGGLAPAVWIGTALFAAAAIRIIGWTVQVNTTAAPVPAFIGRLIRMMIVLQAAWVCTAFGHLGWVWVAGTVIAFAGLAFGADRAAHAFYGS